MKKIIVCLSLCFIFLSSCQNSTDNKIDSTDNKIDSAINVTDATTFILVRHAEKAKEEKDPVLTNLGEQRASKLSSMLRDVEINAIYSSQYKRTIGTAQPTATQKNLVITSYNPGDLAGTKDLILEAHKGETILVVGHSNTTPNFVNLLAGKEVAATIDELEYDNLYIVQYYGKNNAEVMQLRF